MRRFRSEPYGKFFGGTVARSNGSIRLKSVRAASKERENFTSSTRTPLPTFNRTGCGASAGSNVWKCISRPPSVTVTTPATRNASRKASASRRAAMAEIKDSEAAYKEKLEALGTATADTWDSAKQNVISAWAQLQASYYKARAD